MKGINTFTLKLIAVFAMLIDHIGLLLFPECSILRVVGRLAFPIFAYALAEGFVYTKNIKKYLIRLGIFAFVSEVPFDLVVSGKWIDFELQNIFFTLFFALAALALMEKTTNVFLKMLIGTIVTLLAGGACFDYGCMGILMVFLFYYLREKKMWQVFAIAILLLLTSGGIQLFAMLAFIPILMHNRKQGPKWKLFFYLFYPIHLLLIYIVYLIL